MKFIFKKKRSVSKKNIEEIKKLIKEKNSIILNELKGKVNSLIETLERDLKDIKNLDVKDYSSEEKEKSIIEGNKDSFLNQMNILIKNLKELNSKHSGINEFVQEIYSMLDEFDKKSAIAFQKLSFFLGDVFSKLSKDISSFSKWFERFKKSNQSLFQANTSLENLEQIEKEIDKKTNALDSVEKEIRNANNKLADFNNGTKNIKESTKEFLKSDIYLRIQEEKQRLDSLNKEYKRLLGILEDSIDIKSLAGSFHTLPKEMAIINELKKDFSNAIENHSREILGMLKSPEKEKLSSILERISELKDEEKVIKEFISLNDEEKELHDEEAKINANIADVKEEINKLEKKKEQIAIEKNELLKKHKTILEELSSMKL